VRVWAASGYGRFAESQSWRGSQADSRGVCRKRNREFLRAEQRIRTLVQGRCRYVGSTCLRRRVEGLAGLSSAKPQTMARASESSNAALARRFAKADDTCSVVSFVLLARPCTDARQFSSEAHRAAPGPGSEADRVVCRFRTPPSAKLM
jgi:hypothetical protein